MPEVDESREKSGDRGHTDGWSHSSPEKIEAKILHLVIVTVSTHGVGKIETKSESQTNVKTCQLNF